MVGSALQCQPLSEERYDALVEFAKKWMSTVGLERGFSHLGLLRHASKLVPHVTIQEALYAVHQSIWLDKIDSSLMQQMMELGCTDSIQSTTPTQAARRSFQPKKTALITSYPSAIVVVFYPTKKKEQRFMKVSAIVAVAAGGVPP